MKDYKQDAVYLWPMLGAGELHLRPIFKPEEIYGLWRCSDHHYDVAKLTKKYKDLLVGNMANGIVKAEFIPLMIGERTYELLKRIKSYLIHTIVFIQGKMWMPILWRIPYVWNDRKEPEIATLMDFSDSEGILKAGRKCNGAGIVGKTHFGHRRMCPSYHAYKQWKRYGTRVSCQTL